VTYGDGGGLDGEVASGALPCCRRHLRSPRSVSERRGAACARRRRFRLAGWESLARLARADHLRATSVPTRGSDPGQERTAGDVGDPQPVNADVPAIWRQVLRGVAALAAIVLEVDVMVAGVAHVATSSAIISANWLRLMRTYASAGPRLRRFTTATPTDAPALAVCTFTSSA